MLYPCPAPGDYVEIDGVDLGTAGCSNTNRHVQAACWGEGELKWPATGSSEAVYLTNLRQGWSAYDWMRDISDAAAENRFPTKRHISIVGFDASCDETRRLNVFEAWPARIHVFNPTKPYGETPLVDILIVNNWNELSR